MLSNKNYFFKQIYLLLLFFLILLFLSLNIFTNYVYAILPNNNNINNYNPADYKINYNQLHQMKDWKHEEGNVFSHNARVFYNIPGIQMMPCKSYQEFANAKQLTKDGISTVLGFCPGASIIDTGLDYIGIYDRFINCNDSKIAILNDLAYYYLTEDPSKGIFFFDMNDLDKIKEVDISFCDCEMLSADNFYILKIIENFFPKENDSDVEVENSLAQNVEMIMQKQIRKELKKTLIKKLNKKIGTNIAKKSWKRTTKKTVGKTLGRLFVPGIFNIIEKAESKLESENNIQKRCTFNITNNELEQTIGFAINFISEDNIAIYEMRQNQNKTRKSYLINTFNLEDCTHMLINLLQSKHNNKPLNVNIYCGN
ncbi:MAG: hypothetical protein Q8888_02530 [Vigna little leaf phytoplasma]|nr:hypothetical protein [Vigna little leaf phytoplasma]